VCTQEGSEHYPRTDPAVIMSVIDADDRLLLGHGAGWEQGRFSTLAGFVEPGESLEAAVRREVGEEVGVVIGDVIYRGSQPWPFPASIMLGFRAYATSTEIDVDGSEVDEARWFSRAGLDDAIAAGEVRLSPSISIARRLIEDWYGGPIDSPGWFRTS
jgi:NAD+ diphosphatase